jgi:hypothetical protein
VKANALFWTIAAVVLSASEALGAQTPPRMQVQLDADTVGVGDLLHLEVNATSDEDMPSRPQLGASPGFVVRAHSESPSQMMTIVNGTRSDQYKLTADWTLQAQKAGRFTVGPFSVEVRGARYTGHGVTVRVVPAGQAPRRPAQSQAPQSPFGLPFSPFDPWRGLLPGVDSAPQEPQALPAPDPKLALAAPRGVYFFLHAAADKATAVVGEQVTFSVYAYFDVSTGNVEADAGDFHDADVPDFVKRPLSRDDQEWPLVGYASIGDRTWMVKLFRRWALFPLHAGDLRIGPMSVTLTRPRAAAGLRATEPLDVHVTEAPAAGRPPGFAAGDVGRFALAAQVQPRDLEQGGAIGVHVELTGTGNLPGSLTPPVRDGVEWLTPQTHDELGPVAQDAYGGKRSFDFVVYVKRAGVVDLGAFVLPYWDPDRRKYEVATADVGSVHVTASASSASQLASESAAPEVLDGLPGVRDRLEGVPELKSHVDDSSMFWLIGVTGGPLAFCGAVAGRAGLRRAVHGWQSRKASPLAELRQRVDFARRACGESDARAAHAAIGHALESAMVAHRNVSVRGALGSEITERVERTGVDRDAAAEIARLLTECENARFSPESDDIASARQRWARAQASIRQLEQRG